MTRDGSDKVLIMSGQAWALAGVVIGAVLGGGAQILNDWLRHRRQDRDRRRDKREDVYFELLGVTDKLIYELGHAMDLEPFRSSSDGATVIDLDVERVDDIFHALPDLHRVRQRVKTYGSVEIIEIANTIADTVGLVILKVQWSSPVNEAVFAEARDRLRFLQFDLVDLVRSEVGSCD